MRYYWTTILGLWILIAFPTISAAQELVPPPVPTSVPIPAVNGQISGDAPSLAAQANGAAPIASPQGVGFRPGGFFHALSTTKTHLCLKLKQSPLGGLLAEMRKPLSTITGGIVPPIATPSAAEVAAAGPQGTAAQIQAIKVDAPKRVAAIQQLQGIDVRYHPEAAQTLIAALRADPSDCVRLEAARTMATLRVCTKPLAEALRVCVEGTETDGNPAELSSAVKRQAAFALSCCLNCLSEAQTPTIPETRPEYPVTQASLNTPIGASDQTVVQARLNASSTHYYKQVANAPRDLVAQVAHQTLSTHQNFLIDPLHGPSATENSGLSAQLDPSSQPSAPPVTAPPAGLLEIWRASRN